MANDSGYSKTGWIFVVERFNLGRCHQGLVIDLEFQELFDQERPLDLVAQDLLAALEVYLQILLILGGTVELFAELGLCFIDLLRRKPSSSVVALPDRPIPRR